jgi:hypothetical protein
MYKYLLDFDFSQELTIDTIDVMLALIEQTRKRHNSVRCVTKIFSFNGYDIIIKGSFSFKCNKTNETIFLQDLLKIKDKEYIRNLITNFTDEPYKNESFAKLYIENFDFKKFIKIESLDLNPIKTLALSIPDLKDFFYINSKMKDF